MIWSGRATRLALLLATALTAVPALAEAPAAPSATAPDLAAEFRDPPTSARPRVWWHWMNGNISKDGIARDLAWMKRIGLGGVQTFDASLQTPQVVAKRLIYMTPEWQDAFRFAASETDRLGLELAIAASPGWSETGGPWVKPEDGLKKLVWSETVVAGGKRLPGPLALPPGNSGPFQTLPIQRGIEDMIAGKPPEQGPQHRGDVAVLAFPDIAAADLPLPALHDGAGAALDPRALADADLTHGAALAPGVDGQPGGILADYGRAVTVRSASVFLPGAAMPFGGAALLPVLEASADGTAWRTIAKLPISSVPTTASFPAVTARYFRLRLEPLPIAASLGTPVPGAAIGELFGGMGGQAKRPVPVGEFRLSAAAQIDRFEAKAGFTLVPDYFALGGVADAAPAVAPAAVIDLTSRMKPDGTLDWTAPRLPRGGRWRIIRLGYSLLGTTNHPAPPEATGLEVDKFDGTAVRGYLEHYLGMYNDAAGPGMVGQHGVRALLTDSIEVGAANWTPQMIAQFKRLRGYDPVPWLPALTGTLIGSRPESDRFLFDYRRTLADLMASEHYGTVATVAHEHGLKVYGEALEDKRPSLGDDMAMRRNADVPMAALWTYGPEGPRATLLADMKGAASVAHVYGQNLVAAESMTAALSPWAFAPTDLKKFIDLEFVTGVNRPVIHTSVHVPIEDRKPGLSLFIFGQYFNRNETWAELAKPWVDYIARNSLMLQQGRNFADVAYFYGEEAPLTGLYGEKPVADAPTTHAWDFVNADALLGALSNDGDDLVSTGGARYRALYLGGSSRHMSPGVLRRLAELVDGGATVIGPRPQANPGLAGDPGEYAALVSRLWGGVSTPGKGRVIASADLDGTLAQIGIAPDFRFTGGGDAAQIPFVHRRLADGDSYFLVNRLARPETIEAHFRVTGKAPELWHAETGTAEAVSYRIENGETVIPLTLAAQDSVHVVFRQPAVAPALAIKKMVPVALADVTGAWDVAFQPGRGAPARASFARLAPLDQNADPAIRYFSGIADYSNSFAAPNGWRPGRPLWLDLGEVGELAEVRVNGKLAGTAWHAPYRLDIAQFAKPGRNLIEVRVANLWVNRLIGDQQPGAAKVTWTAMPTYHKDAPLRRSGLIGPVRLLGQAR